MIRFARDDEHEALKSLWMACFSDSRAAVDAYFDLRHRSEYMLVEQRETEVSGMLSILPITLISGARQWRGRYVFAVGTHPDHRGRGVSTRLLGFAHDWMRAQGEAAAVLVPATEPLFDFYRRRGYVDLFSLDYAELRSDEIAQCPPDAQLRPCLPEEFLRLRDQAFGGSAPFVRWDREALDYMLFSQRMDGGDVTYFRARGGEGYAVWDRQDDGVIVRELALCGLDPSQAISMLHSKLCMPAYRIRLRANSWPGAVARPFGMIHWLVPTPELSGDAPYLSLAKD